MKKLLIILIIGLVLVSGCGEITGSTTEETSRPEVEDRPIKIDQNFEIPLSEKDVFKCEGDIDCIIKDVGCCDCENGGEGVSINKKYSGYWINKTKGQCKEVECPNTSFNLWTCSAYVKCIDSKCTLDANPRLHEDEEDEEEKEEQPTKVEELEEEPEEEEEILRKSVEAEDIIDYLIITRPMFVDTLKDFTTWKTETSNFKVKVITAEEIDREYSGDNILNKIKNAIRFYYVNHNTDYVLLVGDTELEEHFQLDTIEESVKDYIESYNLKEPWNIPVGYATTESLESDARGNPIMDGKFVWTALGYDLFYADLGEWDKDGDGIFTKEEAGLVGWGYSGKIGLEMYVGRWPVRTNEELKRIIYKTKNYPTIERIFKFSDALPYLCEDNVLNELTDDELKTSCFSSVFSWSPENIPIDFMVNVGDSNEFEINKVKSMIPNYVNFIGFDENTTKEDIINVFISQKSYFIESSHGGHNCIHPYGVVCKEAMKFNEIIPLFEPYSCAVGTFFIDKEDSFSEFLLKSEKGPVVIVTPAGADFYKRLFKSSTVGEAFYAGLNKGFVQGSGWNVLLGDPSLVLYP